MIGTFPWHILVRGGFCFTRWQLQKRIKMTQRSHTSCAVHFVVLFPNWCHSVTSHCRPGLCVPDVLTFDYWPIQRQTVQFSLVYGKRPKKQSFGSHPLLLKTCPPSPTTTTNSWWNGSAMRALTWTHRPDQFYNLDCWRGKLKKKLHSKSILSDFMCMIHVSLALKHFWAHLCSCTVGSYASPSVCPSVRLSVTRK